MELTKEEIKSIQAYQPNFKPEEVKHYREAGGKFITGLLVISRGRKELHDSGFPYIEIIGIGDDAYYELGFHDHFVSYLRTNTDSYGKNVFHVMPWIKGWKVNATFTPCSTFTIGYVDSILGGDIQEVDRSWGKGISSL